MQPTILITRPEPAGQRFADKLRVVLGCDVPVMLSPIIKIEYCGTLPDLAGIGLLIFTSRNGVEAFVRLTSRRDIPCYTVGDATAEFARLKGLTATSCGGDSDRLVARVLADCPPGPCLHIRGQHGVGDIAARLEAGGMPTVSAVLYRQVAQRLSEVAKELLQGRAPVILPLFSPRSARLIFEEVTGSAPLFVAAISAAVAECVPVGDVAAVGVAQRPDADSMERSIIALLEQANALEGGNPAQ